MEQHLIIIIIIIMNTHTDILDLLFTVRLELIAVTKLHLLSCLHIVS